MKTEDSFRKKSTMRLMKGTWIVKLERLQKCKKCNRFLENKTELEKHMQKYSDMLNMKALVGIRIVFMGKEFK